MTKIPLLDLQAQYENIKTEIDAAVLGVLRSGRFILGPEGEALEREIAAFCGVSHAVGVASGTDALLLTLRALGVGAGDEVVTTPFTFFATAETIAALGATPVFADIDPATLNMDLTGLERYFTPRTKAIVAVHIFGLMPDMERLEAIAAAHGIPVVEDAAQAVGAARNGKRAGAWGRAGAFSFFPTKNLGAYGDGGMVATSDADLADRLRVLRFHGCRVKYYHEEIGCNSRLDEIQAAVLRVKLRYLPAWNEARRRVADFYAAAFADLAAAGRLILPGSEPGSEPVYHLYVLRTAERERLAVGLRARGVASAVYYPVPLHLQKAFAALGHRDGDLPRAERACREALAIPCYPELTPAQLEYIAAAARAALED
ncbi:MAG: DegT/DnrJ/EryC1/StrS family aminotransferase [Gracilibacteraceae bacterium]|jgi:dTDP-4-amino-4,6-dideoxygalactose transaminase|nr:DegT/DnrJ/EryC1/StrS family aminotransferase [Gracilibacteraceae bacterium]